MTELSSRELKELRALQTRKERAVSGRFIAEGIRVVEDLLASDLSIVRVVASSSLEDSRRGADLVREIGRRGIELRVVPDRDFARLAATEAPQGVLAVARVPAASLDTAVEIAPPVVVLVLDAVQDPGNLGTLVRSAEALGAACVVALPGTVDPWNPKSVRASAGSSFRIPIVQETWSAVEQSLRRRGFQLLGAAMDGEPIARDAADRVALIVGNEGAGLSREVRRDLDRLVAVPVRGRAESLNVAAAAAILLYELLG